jgi:hypothetical protein
MNRKNRKGVRVQSGGMLSYLWPHSSTKSLWICKCVCVHTFAYICINVRVHAFATECVLTHLPRHMLMSMWMWKQIFMPTFLIWNLYCLSRAINQWCKNTHIDLFYRIWSIRFLRYWLIDKSTELLKLKGRAQIGISNWNKTLWNMTWYTLAQSCVESIFMLRNS